MMSSVGHTSGNQDMSAETFAKIAAIAKSEAGLILAPGKITMVQSRLRKRLVETGQPDYETYCRFVSSTDGTPERRNMISALTTNVSHFFREPHHFDILSKQVAPTLLRRAREGKSIRIWSAGCSSGQEPYSIAMCLLDAEPDLKDRDLLILGTDIDPAILEKARAATYSQSQTSGIPEAMRKSVLTAGRQPGQFTVNDSIKRLVRFRELNLHRDWPMRGQFDAIFCRNVVIYFDAAAQSALWPRFYAKLKPDGWFFLGHSERVSDDCQHLFDPCGFTSYKIAGQASRDAANKDI